MRNKGVAADILQDRPRQPPASFPPRRDARRSRSKSRCDPAQILARRKKRPSEQGICPPHKTEHSDRHRQFFADFESGRYAWPLRWKFRWLRKGSRWTPKEVESNNG